MCFILIMIHCAIFEYSSENIRNKMSFEDIKQKNTITSFLRDFANHEVDNFDRYMMTWKKLKSKIQDELTIYFRKTIHNQIKLKNDENDTSTTISNKHKYTLKSLTILNQLKQVTRFHFKNSIRSMSNQLSRDSIRKFVSSQNRISLTSNLRLSNNVINDFASIESRETISLISSFSCFFSSTVKENDTQTTTSKSDVKAIDDDVAVKKTMKDVINLSKA